MSDQGDLRLAKNRLQEDPRIGVKERVAADALAVAARIDGETRAVPRGRRIAAGGSRVREIAGGGALGFCRLAFPREP